MSGNLIYCHMCGAILEKDTTKQIIARSWETKKSKKLFDVCYDCADKVEHMKFPVQRIKYRKKLNFSSIVIKGLSPRREYTVYDVLPYQLDIIKGLEVDIDKLRLRYKNGSRLYTEFQVRKWMLKSRKNLLEALHLLYQYQTDDEKENRETKYSNAVGFNKPDADFLTGMAKLYESGGTKVFTIKQVKAVETRLLKYVKQITLYVNAEGKILSGI